MTRLVCLLLTAAFAAANDDQDLAIAHVINLKGYMQRDEKKPGRPVVAVYLSNNQAPELGLKKLAAFPELHTLDISNSYFNDTMAADLLELKALRKLYLNGTAATGATYKTLADSKIETLFSMTLSEADAREMAGMKSLTTLRPILDAKNADAVLTPLAAIPNLTSLDLSQYPVTDAGLPALAGAKKLVSLNLIGTKVTDAGCKSLAASGSLTDLDFFGCPITGAGLAALAPLKITRIAVSGKQIVDADAAYFLQWPTLNHIRVSGTSIGDTGFMVITKIKTLTSLWFDDTPATDETLKLLVNLPDLQTLSCWGCKITPAGIAALAPLKKLTFIQFESENDAMATALNQAGLMHTVYWAFKSNTTRFDRPRNAAEVGEFNLNSAKDFTGAGLKQLAGFKNVKTILLSRTNIDDAGMKEMAPFAETESLLISDCPITDAGLKHLAGMKKLKTFYLNGSLKITDEGLKELEILSSLKQLTLVGTSCSPAGVKSFMKAVPGCKVENR